MNVQENNTPVLFDFQSLNSLSLQDAALAYARQGFRIFPLQPGTKLPYPGWSWKQAASTDPDIIRHWWQLYPQSNIGLACGAGSGIDVLDIDRKNGHDGLKSYQAICQDRYTGPVQSTPSGGSHLLFAHTPSLINFTHRGDLGGLDMRTDGGYVVAAPSRTADGMYSWQTTGMVPGMPISLLAACQRWSTQSNTQVIEAPDIPEDLPDITTLGLKPEHLNYLLHGDASHWQDDRSRAVFSVAGALMYRLQDPGRVFGLLCANEHAWQCASDHREFGNPATWLWKYGIAKIIAQTTLREASSVFQTITSPTTPNSPAFFLQGSKVQAQAAIRPRWIVKGVIEEGQVGLVYGDSQTFKSYLMLDLSACVARGCSWHGLPVVNPGPVWLLAGEGNAILKRRLEAYRQEHDLESESLAQLWLSEAGLNLMDTTHQQFLHDQLAHCNGEPPRMLVIDTLSTNAILDENNARDAGELVALCYRIAREWNCTVILVHHVGKTNKGASRGSSVWQANTDFRIKVERHPGEKLVTQLFVEKLKGAPEPRYPLAFEGLSRIIVGVLEDDLTPVRDLVFKRITDKEKLEALQRKTKARLKGLTKVQEAIQLHIAKVIQEYPQGLPLNQFIDLVRKEDRRHTNNAIHNTIQALANITVRTQNTSGITYVYLP